MVAARGGPPRSRHADPGDAGGAWCVGRSRERGGARSGRARAPAGTALHRSIHRDRGQRAADQHGARGGAALLESHVPESRARRRPAALALARARHVLVPLGAVGLLRRHLRLRHEPVRSRSAEPRRALHGGPHELRAGHADRPDSQSVHLLRVPDRSGARRRAAVPRERGVLRLREGPRDGAARPAGDLVGRVRHDRAPRSDESLRSISRAEYRVSSRTSTRRASPSGRRAPPSGSRASGAGSRTRFSMRTSFPAASIPRSRSRRS